MGVVVLTCRISQRHQLRLRSCGFAVLQWVIKREFIPYTFKKCINQTPSRPPHGAATGINMKKKICIYMYLKHHIYILIRYTIYIYQVKSYVNTYMPLYSFMSIMLFVPSCQCIRAKARCPRRAGVGQCKALPSSLELVGTPPKLAGTFVF